MNEQKNPFVFVVDDDASMRDSLSDLLGSAGLNVQTFASAREFLASPRPDGVSCLVLDVQLPGFSGLDLQQELAKLDTPIPIIFITGYGDIPTSVRAIKAGAIEFLTKPFRDEDLLNAVEQAIKRSPSKQSKNKPAEQKSYSKDRLHSETRFSEIIGQSAPLRCVLKEVETVASTGSTVLIYGETGTGKELIARAIHNISSRSNRPFVKVNCAAIPSGLLESELFGHEKGAFTGAVTQKIGRFELAHEGTLFLDEVGDLPLELQPKLLRVLQEQEFERLGSTRTTRVDVRIVAATNRDLAQMAGAKEFREDLYFRLNVFPIKLPSLRERPGDIPLLVRHYVDKYSQRMNKRVETIPPEAMPALCSYSWPGNIRELQNVIERSVVLCDGDTFSADAAWLKRESPQLPSPSGPFGAELADHERRMIEAALTECRGRVAGPAGAAAKLGIPRQTLDSKIASLRIDKQQFKTASAGKK